MTINPVKTRHYSWHFAGCEKNKFKIGIFFFNADHLFFAKQSKNTRKTAARKLIAVNLHAPVSMNEHASNPAKTDAVRASKSHRPQKYPQLFAAERVVRVISRKNPKGHAVTAVEKSRRAA